MEKKAFFSPQTWKILSLTLLLSFYAVLTIVAVQKPLEWMGLDFVAYWGAGYVANHASFADMYNLSVLEKAEHIVVFGQVMPGAHLHPNPMPYLPIFALPFRFLALFPPVTAFWIWTAGNFILGSGYLLYLSNLYSGGDKKYVFLAFALSFSFFQTLFWGQIDIWLMVFAGEFLRTFRERKEFRAGLWVSLLLLKPQTLIVLLPALLVARRFKTLLGFAVGSVFILAGSLAVAGKDGLVNVWNLWTKYSVGIPTNSMASMNNWRMVAHNTNRIYPSQIWVYLAVTLSVLTILWAAYLWLRGRDQIFWHSELFALTALSATMLAAWHSHVHMAVVLIPPLVLLALKEQLPQALLNLWLFLPVIFYLAVFVILLFFIETFDKSFYYGPAQFMLNCVLLAWSSKKILQVSEK